MSLKIQLPQDSPLPMPGNPINPLVCVKAHFNSLPLQAESLYLQNVPLPSYQV